MTAFARLGGESMGTSWSVQCDDADGRDLHALHAEIEECLSLVVAQMSTWEAESEISRFNASPAGTWQKLSPEIWQVLSCAQLIAALSDGAFDATVGAKVARWGFGAHAFEDFAHSNVTYRDLEMDSSERAILQTGGMQLDLSAIAKGYSADLIAARLMDLGARSMLVDVGGELRAVGDSPRGGAWNVLLESDQSSDPCVVALKDCAIATSGDRFFRHEIQGRSVSHTIDPRNGEPINDETAQVSVIAESAMLADGWATALAVMGVEKGVAFANAQGLAVRYTLQSGQVACSDAFKPYEVDA